MQPENLVKEISVKIKLGHLLLVWQVMSDNFSDLRSNHNLSVAERRAIWGLSDLLEEALIENGITGKPQAEWDALINQAKELIKTIPVDFLD